MYRVRGLRLSRGSDTHRHLDKKTIFNMSSGLYYLRKLQSIGMSAFGVVGKVGFLVGGTLLGFGSHYIVGHCPKCGNSRLWFGKHKTHKTRETDLQDDDHTQLVCGSMDNINATLSELNKTFLNLVDLRKDITALANQHKEKLQLKEELEMIKYGIKQAFPNMATSCADTHRPGDKLKVANVASSQETNIFDTCIRLDQEQPEHLNLREANASVAKMSTELSIDKLRGSPGHSEEKGLLGSKC